MRLLSVWSVLAFAELAAAGGAQPQFSYSPAIVQPGQIITVAGSQFSSASLGALIALTSDAAQVRILGSIPVVNGAFNAQFTVPVNLAPGRYLVGVADQALRGATNLTGTLTIAPASGPWFQVSPPSSPAGGVISVSGRGYSSNASIAGIGLVNEANQVTVLGYAPIVKGSFARTFALPDNLTDATTYRAFALGSDGQYGIAVMGHFSTTVARVTASIPVGAYPVGIEVNPLTNRIYAGNSGDSTVSVIDGASNQVIATIPVGDLPCAMAANLANNRLYVANLNSNNVSVIDGATHVVVATVPVGASPCAVRVLPALNRVYIGNYRSNNITVISTATNQVVATIPLAGPPYGLGVNTQTNRVYSGTGIINALNVIDGLTNTVIASVPAGKGPDAIAVNPTNNRIYVGNYFSDTLTVVDGGSNTIVTTVRVGREPSGVAVNPVTGRVFVGNYGSDTVTVLEGLTNQISATIAVGDTPDGITVNPATGRVYSVNSNTRDVSVILDPPANP